MFDKHLAVIESLVVRPMPCRRSQINNKLSLVLCFKAVVKPSVAPSMNINAINILITGLTLE